MADTFTADTFIKDAFITKIHISKVRHLSDVDIVLSDTTRKHLILTGKNGSGKTSLLEAIRDFVVKRQYQMFQGRVAGSIRMMFQTAYAQQNKELQGVSVNFSGKYEYLFTTIFAYLAAERNRITVPKEVKSVEVKDKTIITKNASRDFLQYMLHLYIQYLSAKDASRPSEEVEPYKDWFDRFTQVLRDIYDCPSLMLLPDMKHLIFKIALPEREPFGLHEMSDGYNALLEIVMELLMRMEKGGGVVDYAQPAIVLVDELETHLHVALQKQALPFLTRLFPNVQFIVTTHSPFVITSLADAVVYDLEKHECLQNPSFYSYESVVESFLDTDMYSEAMRRQLDRYKALCFKERTPEENEEFLRTKTALELMSPASKELYVAFRDLEQKRIAQKRNAQNRTGQECIKQEQNEQGQSEQERIDQVYIEQERIDQEYTEQNRIVQKHIAQNQKEAGNG